MWSTASFDDELGLVYVPLGVATGALDFWGARRTKESELYGNSVVALDVMTGRPRWHFQIVHHDLWDYDLPPQPVLFNLLDGNGDRLPALIQGTKHGQIFLLDRRVGRPISPVVERPVPQGGQPDDWTSPTQPYSVGMPSIGAEMLTEANMWGLTPFDQLLCRIQFKRLRYEGEFTPPTTSPALLYPSLLGGMNWGSLSLDESRGYLIVNDIRLPMIFQLLRSESDDRMAVSAAKAGEHSTAPSGTEASHRATPYTASLKRFTSPLGLPCNAPPWGTMTAIDLASRTVAWQVPIGTASDVGPFGLKLGLPITIGLPTVGGALTTQSGLVFFSGAGDSYLRALDVRTGVELWKAPLPVGSQARPMTYISTSGRQFVVTVAGGGPVSEDEGDYVISYALKESE